MRPGSGVAEEDLKGWGGEWLQGVTRGQRPWGQVLRESKKKPAGRGLGNHERREAE